ncbi:hypothetical protein OG394_28410 [Kribbella sp. NBC_01245]|uniref:hypothetical protein n=1 Tax=Kribbella sp. NBC_01245 TaxID=2903578 RepID=UPI002E28680E|nr:hypothetical protein [Kribbella sp. NBC_01245]
MSADCVLLPGLRHPQAAELVETPGAAPPVDAYEVAAALEASGVSDRTAQERYGHPDVFSLGKSLLAGLRAEAPVLTRTAVAGRIDVRQTLQRGLVFVLPALLTGAAMGERTAPAEVVLLLVAVAYGWAAGQGVAYAGYAMTGAGSYPEARRLMRDLAALAFVPAVVGLGATGWFNPSIRYVAVVAIGQIAFVLASTIGVVLHRPGLMLLVLIPGLLVSLPDVLRPSLLPKAIVLPVIATSVLATVVVALVLCRDGRRAARPVTRAVLADCRLYVGYGACLASLLTLGLLDGLVVPGGRVGIGLTLMPLVGGVLVAEWQLARYRSRAELALRTTNSADRFAARIHAALLRCFGWYLALLIALIALAASSVDHLDFNAVLRFAATGLLGWSFLAALLLVAHRLVAPVLLVTGIGVVFAAARYLVLGPPSAFDLAIGYLAVCGSLAITLTVLVWQWLPAVEVHR